MRVWVPYKKLNAISQQSSDEERYFLGTVDSSNERHSPWVINFQINELQHGKCATEEEIFVVDGLERALLGREHSRMWKLSKSDRHVKFWFYSNFKKSSFCSKIFFSQLLQTCLSLV